MQTIIVLNHLMVAIVCALECAVSLRDLRGQLPRLLIFLALGLIHGIVPAITPAEFLMAGFSDRSRLSAAALALVGVILFSLGWRLYDAMRPRLRGVTADLEGAIESVAGQTLLRRLFWLCGLCGIPGWFWSVFAGGIALADVFTTARFAHRATEERYLAAVAEYFVILAMIPGFVCFFLPHGYRAIGIVYALCMALLLFLASQGRGRTL